MLFIKRMSTKAKSVKTMESSVTSTCFVNMTKTEQVIMVLQTGKELSIRNHLNYTVHLYLVTGLLVELWYISDSNTIAKTSVTTKEKAEKQYRMNSDLSKYFLLINDATN